jgi:hypothetical protein
MVPTDGRAGPLSSCSGESDSDSEEDSDSDSDDEMWSGHAANGGDAVEAVANDVGRPAAGLPGRRTPGLVALLLRPRVNAGPAGDAAGGGCAAAGCVVGGVPTPGAWKGD